eukprot:SAG31_NODE_568_length_14006_cov_4.252119_11_plen_123_part_00
MTSHLGGLYISTHFIIAVAQLFVALLAKSLVQWRPLLTASIMINLGIQGTIWDGHHSAAYVELARVTIVAAAAAWFLLGYSDFAMEEIVTKLAWTVFVFHTISALSIVASPKLLAARCTTLC